MLQRRAETVQLQAAESPAREWRRNWTVVLAAAVGMGLLSVPTYSTGVFIKPLEEEFGWSRAAITSGKLFGALTGLILGPLVGLVIDRSGPKRLALVGSVIMCALIAMLSLTSPNIVIWWALWGSISLAALLIKPTVWTAGVSSLFSAGRGLALGVALSGTVLASTLTPILGNYLIEQYGWRAAYLGLALMWAVLGLPLIFAFFDSAHDRRRTGSVQAGDAAVLLAGVSPRQGLLSWRFVKLATAALLATLITASFVVSLVPVLIALGQPSGKAAAVAGAMGLATVPGRLLSGYLSDRINANLIAAAAMLLPIVACALLLLVPGSLATATAAALLLGFTLGTKLHVVAYLTTRHFGMRSFGVLFGTIAGLFGLATGVGPVAMNYAYDVTGSYNIALIAAVPLAMVASSLFLSLGRYPRFDALPEQQPRGLLT
jgi:MFS family permease